ncbi:hypothetical protein CPB84DRAFT_1672473 [Gymnopilus junonius]|uniref:PhoD-like phosphatase domain-containing protein n=1 Tax=Gymnopilus junonius TaxID=109634 RepID=A0A9P5P1P3_GYMJU|nr:hypothetical protein CPB84DRAFT_1672473 [Gymnopilus junonius]
MEESFIGGFRHQLPPPSPRPPAVPPKDLPHHLYQSSRPSQSTISTAQLTQLTAVERSQVLRVARMDPHLQFMCGPLLKYDTTDEHGIWHGAALIITADSGSIYEPHPTLTYTWDSERPAFHPASPTKSYELGPHPADPHSTVLAASPSMGTFGFHPGFGRLSTFTFWRFLIKVPLAQHEMSVRYSINKGQQLEFWVPGRNQNMRWAAYSCNGFSSGVNPDDFRGPGFKSGYDPVWMDLLSKHAETPFHALVGGGDQLYCDAIMREPELQEWVSLSKPEEKKTFSLTPEIELAIDRFFFNHYCHMFRSGAFARANCSIPMINMCDDHGMYSYPDDLQRAPVFQQCDRRKGIFFFLLFQCFINVEMDGISDAPGRHVYQSAVIGEVGPYVRLRSHSFLPRLGPRVYMLLLDCRAERRKDQVCSQPQYQHVFDRLNNLPAGVEHLIVQLGIPIAYPRMVFLETALESRFNPLVALGRNGSLGLSGFVNKFNADAELLDDLNDHWTARSHKKERNWLIEQLQNFARIKRIRVTFLSGDVHCAAVGVLKTLKGKNRPEVSPRMDHRYMVNIVTSAIVNTPPPNGVITMVSSLASKVHKTLHSIETDETMEPIFAKEPSGQSRKQKFIMGRRNWCSFRYNENSKDMVFDIRVEREKGEGITVGYPMSVPPPCW